MSILLDQLVSNVGTIIVIFVILMLAIIILAEVLGLKLVKGFVGSLAMWLGVSSSILPFIDAIPV